jgi:hypothetical protein
VKDSTFWIYLMILSALTLMGVFFVHGIEDLHPHQNLSISMFVLMFLTTVFLFYYGKKATLSSNKYLFIRMVIVSVMVKIVLVLLILVVYVRQVEIDNRLFILPFISIYLIFSIFETVVLYQLAAEKTQTTHE